MTSVNGDWWGKLLKFWPIVIILGMVLAAGIRAQFQIEGVKEDISEIRKDRESEVNQWRRINSNGQGLVEHEGRLKEIEKHITPEAVQEWGRVKAQVDANARMIERLRER